MDRRAFVEGGVGVGLAALGLKKGEKPDLTEKKRQIAETASEIEWPNGIFAECRSPEEAIDYLTAFRELIDEGVISPYLRFNLHLQSPPSRYSLMCKLKQ